MDGADPPAIRAFWMLESLQIHAERGVELRHRSRQDDSTPPRMLLHDGEPMRVGEFLDGSDIGLARAELLIERLTTETGGVALSPRELPDMLRERAAIAAAQQHADFQPFRGIGLTDGRRAGQRPAFAARKFMSRHIVSSPKKARRPDYISPEPVKPQSISDGGRWFAV